MMQLAIASGLSFSGLLRRQASSSFHKLHITGHIFPRGASPLPMTLHAFAISFVKICQGDGGCDVHKARTSPVTAFNRDLSPRHVSLHPIFPTMCPRGSTRRFTDSFGSDQYHCPLSSEENANQPVATDTLPTCLRIDCRTVLRAAERETIV